MPGLLAEGREQGHHAPRAAAAAAQEQDMADPGACARPLGPRAARPVENVTQMFL